MFPDGKASVEYVVRYTVVSEEFHGFYFEGFDRLTPFFDRENASAIDSTGNTYGLDIIRMNSNKFETIKKENEEFKPSIMLAQGKNNQTVPVDARFSIAFSNAPEGIYGLQAQINLNVVQGEAAILTFTVCWQQSRVPY